MNQAEIKALFAANIQQLNKLNIAAGSMVKTLLQSAENSQVYLELSDPEEGGHSIGYRLVEGDERVVSALADYLGLTLAGNRIEVNDA